MIRIIIVEDVPLLRESLKTLLESDNEIKVVGTAQNGREAAKMCDVLLPEVVLMDIVMPVCDGIVGTKLIKSKHKSIKVIMLTTFEDEEKIYQALKNGADGYILKDVTPQALRLVISSAKEGMPIVHHKVFDTIVRQFEDTPQENTYEKDTILKFKSLSKKEKSIVKLIIQGKGNKEIAAIINLKEGTIKNNISDMLDKLGFEDRTQLAVFAAVNKLV